MGIERRFLGGPAAELGVTTREAGTPPGIRGYAALYNSLSDMIGGAFREEIAPGAFATILARKPDVRALVNHDPSHILARSGAGTLQLTHTVKGLLFDVPTLPDTSAARDVAESIRRGDLDQCSFAFSKAADTWREEIIDGRPTVVRTLLDFELHDVSVVTFAAYPDTEVGLRTAFDSLKAWAATRRGKSLQRTILDILAKF